MLRDLSPDQLELKTFMSDLSEKCWSAVWMDGTEYVLWEALLNGERNWGQREITNEEIQSLKKFTEKLECWIYFDDENEETAISLEDWENKYLADTQSNPGLIKRYP